MNVETCCPNYPIQCNAIEYQLTRSQRKCIENFNLYLVDGLTKYERPGSKQTNCICYGSGGQTCGKDCEIIQPSLETLEQSKKARQRRLLASCMQKMRLHKITFDAAYSMVVGRYRKRQDIKRSNRKASENVIETYMFPTKSNLTNGGDDFKPMHKLEIKLAHVESLTTDQLDEEHRMMLAYQEAIHHEKREDWTFDRFHEFLVETPLITVPIKDRDYVKEFQQASGSFCKQVVNNPESFILAKPTQLPTCYGTYHCCYYIDGALAAVGVLDFLPGCLTTVYFFYDPKFAHLNLGTYSALYEISIVRQMHEHFAPQFSGQVDDFLYYHLGFYVPTCKKMSYKTTFKPSYMLCSETWQYVPTDACMKLLQDRKYARFCADPRIQIEEISLEMCHEIIMNVPDLSNRGHEISTFGEYYDWIQRELNPAAEVIARFMKEYAKHMGRPLIYRIRYRSEWLHRLLLRTYKPELIDAVDDNPGDSESSD